MSKSKVQRKSALAPEVVAITPPPVPSVDPMDTGSLERVKSGFVDHNAIRRDNARALWQLRTGETITGDRAYDPMAEMLIRDSLREAFGVKGHRIGELRTALATLAGLVKTGKTGRTTIDRNAVRTFKDARKYATKTVCDVLSSAIDPVRNYVVSKGGDNLIVPIIRDFDHAVNNATVNVKGERNVVHMLVSAIGYRAGTTLLNEAGESEAWAEIEATLLS